MSNRPERSATVIPAQAGIPSGCPRDSRFRGNDEGIRATVIRAGAGILLEYGSEFRPRGNDGQKQGHEQKLRLTRNKAPRGHYFSSGSSAFHT